MIDRLNSAGQAQTLVAAIRALPPAERDVLLLVAWEQLTPAQAARALGVPAGTARSRLLGALAAPRLTRVCGTARALLMTSTITGLSGLLIPLTERVPGSPAT